MDAPSTTIPPTSGSDWQTQRRSTSQRRTYRACGYKFLLQYQQGWRKTAERGTYAFGHVMQSMADLILLRLVTDPTVAEQLFRAKWAPYEKDETRTWTTRMPWATLRDRGATLVRLMVTELPRVLGRPDPAHLDEEWTYEIAPGVFEQVRPDFYGPIVGSPGATSLEGGPWKLPAKGVIDFKTGERAYGATAAEIDEQLTDYQLGEQRRDRPVDVVGLCVLVYTVKPQIQWLLHPARDAEELDRFVVNAVATDRQIRDGVFVRNPGNCNYYGECFGTPLCFKSQAHRLTELRQTKPGEATLIDLDDQGD